MIDLVLCVFINEDGSFQVYRKIQEPVWIPNSVFNTDEFPKWR
jgi:hypothetical protein